MSNDPVLQTRVMAYADAQRYRLGVNYQLLPVNIPACPFHNNHNDGAMNYTIKDEEVCSRAQGLEATPGTPRLRTSGAVARMQRRQRVVKQIRPWMLSTRFHSWDAAGLSAACALLEGGSVRSGSSPSFGVGCLQPPVRGATRVAAHLCPAQNRWWRGLTGCLWHDCQVNYWPSKIEKTAEAVRPEVAQTHISKEPITGVRVKEDLFVGDDYKQAGDRVRSMDQHRCSHAPPALGVESLELFRRARQPRSRSAACGRVAARRGRCMRTCCSAPRAHVPRVAAACRSQARHGNCGPPWESSRVLCVGLCSPSQPWSSVREPARGCFWSLVSDVGG